MGCVNSTEVSNDAPTTREEKKEDKKETKEENGKILPIQFHGINMSGKQSPKPTDKILIIGAGPSGLHIGHLLKKKGYTNIKFYEASDRVAGKSLSVTHRVQKDVVHELGTCYMHPAYNEVRALLEELEEAAKNGVSQEVEPKEYKVYAKNQPNLEGYFEDKDYIDFKPWIYATVEKQVLPKAFWFLPDKLSACSLVLAIEKYVRVYKDIMGEFEYNLLPPLHQMNPEKYEKIRKPFLKFLEEHDLSALIPLLGYGMTAQGYGVLQTMPTYYAMIWVTPKLLQEYINPLCKYPMKVMLVKGFQTLWETLYKVDGFDVTFNCNIESVERMESGVKVKGVYKKGDETLPIPQEDFDYVIISCPPKQESLNMDWRDEEKEIFSKLESSVFITTLFERDPDPELKEHLSIWPEFLIGEHSGEGDVYACRDSSIALKIDNRTDQHDLREQMCYQIWDDKSMYSEEAAKAKIDKFASNIPGFKILEQYKFDYFYRFQQKELDQGYPYKILDLQGRNRSFFVHASVHFESILDIIKYNNMLVKTLFQ